MVDDSADKPEIDTADVAEVVEKSSKVSIVWIFPIAAALLGAWLLYRSITEAGVPITLSFESGRSGHGRHHRAWRRHPDPEPNQRAASRGSTAARL